MADPLIPNEQDEAVRKRQRSRALVTALALAAFVLLLYFVTIAKMTVNQ